MPKIVKDKGIYRRGKIWWITYMDSHGKQRYESSGSTLKTDAVLLLSKRRLEINEGNDPTFTRKRDRQTTFSELVEKYRPVIANQKGAATKRIFLEQLDKEFGHMKLVAFTRSMLEAWQSRCLSEPRKREKGGEVTELPPLRPATVNRRLACLKHMFTKALDWDMVSEGVVKKVRSVKFSDEQNKRLRYLSVEEIDRLLSACDAHLKPVVTVALNTGMRRGEILGLTWDRVDLKHGFIFLEDHHTKSGKRREVPINNLCREALQSVVRRLDIPYVFYNPLTASRITDRKKAGADGPKTGKAPTVAMCRYTDLKKSFGTACKKAGLDNFHFHDLRHTFASQLVMNGVDITTVSRLLGHASLTMTLRYAHLAPNHLQSAVNVLSNRYRSAA